MSEHAGPVAAPERITVLGGGNTSFSVAANLALAGHAVLLWEHPDYAWTIEPIRERRAIHLDGAARTGAAKLAGVTTDAGEALAWSDVVLMAVPAYAHRAFAEACAPHVRPGHLIALLPGTLGSLAFAEVLRAHGVRGATLAESDSAPYVCRKTAPDRAVIWGVLAELGFGVFPCRVFKQSPDDTPLLWNADTSEPDIDRYLRKDIPWQTASTSRRSPRATTRPGSDRRGTCGQPSTGRGC